MATPSYESTATIACPWCAPPLCLQKWFLPLHYHDVFRMIRKHLGWGTMSVVISEYLIFHRYIMFCILCFEIIMVSALFTFPIPELRMIAKCQKLNLYFCSYACSSLEFLWRFSSTSPLTSLVYILLLLTDEKGLHSQLSGTFSLDSFRT